MAQETTLILFKPDCVQKRLGGTVLQRFEAAGFTGIRSEWWHFEADGAKTLPPPIAGPSNC